MASAAAGEFPCNFVIFGATGNLATNKLLPALYHLQGGGRLPAGLRLVAFSRRDWDTDTWLAHMRAMLEQKLGARLRADVFEPLAARFTYVRGELHDFNAYLHLAEVLGWGGCSANVFYLSIKPAEFADVAKFLAQAKLNRGERGAARVVVEKPFGEDLESARELNDVMHRHFTEDQIFRIDHYLGKETVQNLMVFRFANTLIEPIWNRNYIDQVQITVAEDIGIDKRADYYDHAGALRDMLQNHMMQILTVVAMEPPPAFEADALRDEKVKVLRSIRQIPRRAVHAHAFRAQYGPGTVGGQRVQGYQQEVGVEPNSVTETFVAAKFYVDNWRWKGVPFYLRTGKRLARPLSMVAIRFRHPPQQLFRETPLESLEPNWIILSIQPQQSMNIELHVKAPGLDMDTRVMSLNASYLKLNETSLDAYEALLLDVIEGDRTLFIRFDEVEWAWRVVDPILKYWAQEREFIQTYPAGTWGPEGANRLFDAEDHYWRDET